MSEVESIDGASADVEKPVQPSEPKFPPFPEPTDEDFDDDIGEEERIYYKNKFPDINSVRTMRLHCSACDRHLGSSTRNENRMRAHPMLRTLVCQSCHTFYNSGEFEKGDDGSELYCRWCGQGGQVYCCADCPHVFCAKCVKRNFGPSKIKEIENADDWKCFKCNPNILWDLRALCWALLRYCDQKNKITYKTEDQQLKDIFVKDCAQDYTECCKNKSRRKEKPDSKTTKKDTEVKKVVAGAISKLPSTIQVKKFASILADESFKEKRPMKRPASPVRNKANLMRNPIPISPSILSPVSLQPIKKMRMPMTVPFRVTQEKKNSMPSYHRIRPKQPTLPIPILTSHYNGPSNNAFSQSNSVFNPTSNSYTMHGNDNINLSLENLTQGLDMAAVVAMSNNNVRNHDDDVVCTPDFPLEPLCEVTEDNNDDDVQCITPAPVIQAPKSNTPPPLARISNTLPELSSDNIVQMTENDVTVNTVTGGLKFRVDPQTLSSNKMYRLPDGRIFAINANPNMPGGYSATIVAVTETSGKISAPKGVTYAAKLSSVSSVQTSTPAKQQQPNSINRVSRSPISKGGKSKNSRVSRGTVTSQREYDLQIPIEWYRYNLIDAVDALEYSLSRLNKLKREATTMYLRSRTIEEIKNLHKTLERSLNTSATRLNEIRDNLNKECKNYLQKKMGDDISDDDDDVEILPNLDENDDPIYIDENSVDSTTNDLTCNENLEVDLTDVGNSDHNDSGENKCEDNEENNHQNISKDEGMSTINKDESLVNDEKEQNNHDKSDSEKVTDNEIVDDECQKNESESEKSPDNKSNHSAESQIDNDDNLKGVDNKMQVNGDTQVDDKNDSKSDKEFVNDEAEKVEADISNKEIENKDNDDGNVLDDISMQESESKTQDSELSEELIETLLKDDNADETNKIVSSNAMEVSESV